LVEKEIAFVKVQLRKAGNFMVTIPKDAAKAIGIIDNERLKVFIDIDKKRIIYELTE
jgi:bifunctional DNA-binding transcriptional regulator/antitoxin component of YhaV-PrlF toxin-antitoxin module